MSVFETLQLMLATETLIVVLLGLVVELIKLISKKK
ncbi:putative holin-like toxin [Ligilactobacillus pabuli]|nr:putative holin-like toxin [Ligilactobacillus pabuli]